MRRYTKLGGLSCLNFTDATINLATQTTILAIVLASLAFRMKGNYKVHLITMAIGVVFGIVVASLGFTFAFDSASMQTFTNSTLNLAVFVSHGFLAIASFAFGIVVVALLLMDKSIAARSNLMAKIVAVLWILAYVIGVTFYLILHVI
jgi:uncharacterized membrane protein YozB (DUF420 family)